MKKAFKSWYNYIIAIVIDLVIALIAIVPYFAFLDSAKWPKQYISYVFLFAGVVVFGIGFIIQDLYRARIRHKTKNWNNPLEEQNLETAWAIFTPLLLAGLTSVLIGGISSIFLK